MSAIPAHSGSWWLRGLQLLRAPAWVWVGSLLGMVLVGLALVSQPPVIEGAFTVRKAQFAGESIDNLAIKSVALPHIWDNEKPPLHGTARYQIDWPAALQTVQPYAIYLPRVGARFQVLLNGQVIQSEYWDRPGYSDTSVVPHWVALPPGMLLQPLARNKIELRVQGQLLRKSGVSELVIGPQALIESRYAKVYWWQVQATWMVAAVSVVLAVLSGLIWLQNRERVFGMLSAACIAWAVRLGLTPLVSPGMPFEAWFFLHKLSFTVYCGFLYLFMWELFDFQQGFARRLVTGMLWLGPLWLGLTTLTGIYDLYRIWTGAIALVSLVTLLLMFQRARWGLDDNQRLMVVVGVVTLVTGIRDFLVVQLDFPGDGDMRWMTMGSLVLMMTLTWVMVQRTSGYVQQIGQLNLDLEQRVSQKESELRSVFEHLREAENRQVLEAERQRLTRDMHDGLGSQLVQTLNLVRAPSPVDPNVVAAMLAHALDELRMTLDSLEPMEGDLPAILGTLRQRLSPALDAAGIELDWQVQEVPPITVQGLPLDSRGVMHLFRCLQEIFANIIKHAGASRVVVRTWHSVAGGAEMVYLSVADNGCGLAASASAAPAASADFAGGGRGLENIRVRAAALDASVQYSAYSAADAPAASTAGLGLGTQVTFAFKSAMHEAPPMAASAPQQPDFS